MDKKSLRQAYIAKRNSLEFSEKVALESKIKDFLFQNFNFSQKVVSCFLPISSKNELDTWPIIQQIINQGGKVALTVWDNATNCIFHRLWTVDTKIKHNAYEIPEPVNGDFITNDQIDIVIVPLLVMDKFGNRVGYGKGVYDRFLASCVNKTIFIGLSHFELIERIEDVNPYDIPLNYCITPFNCVCFEKQS